MSRGYGRTQRHVLDVLAFLDTIDTPGTGYPPALTVDEVARFPSPQHISDVDAERWYEELIGAQPAPRRARVESVRRACVRLEDDGRVELFRKRVVVGAKVRLPRYAMVYGDDRGYCDYAERWLLFVRRLMTPAEREVLEAEQERRRERLRADVAAAYAKLYGGGHGAS